MNAVIQSEHFTLHLVTEGVYAAIATEGGAGFSNAGIINLGDQTLVFDAFENPQAAEDLLRACLQLTNRKPEVESSATFTMITGVDCKYLKAA